MFGSRSAVAVVAVEVHAVRRGVIEHAVENDLHAAAVQFRRQRGEGRVAAERRIDVQIVVGVVAVIGAGREDRVHVDGVDAERLDVIEFVLHALQIAAVELIAELVVAGRAGIARIADLRVPEVVGERLLVAVVDRDSRSSRPDGSSRWSGRRCGSGPA